MPTPGEHKAVQGWILEYAEPIDWTLAAREETQDLRGFDPNIPPIESAINGSLFLYDLGDAQRRIFKPFHLKPTEHQ